MKKIHIILLSAAGVLAAIYLIVAGYFSFHYLPGSVIGGKDISNMTVVEVEDVIRATSGTYVLTVTGRNGLTDHITAQDVELTPQFDGSLERYLGFVNGLKWPSALWTGHIYEDTSLATISDSALDARLKSLTFTQTDNIVAPTDAELVFDEEQAKYAIVPETYGAQPDNELLRDAISQALLAMLPDLSLDEADVYVKPHIFSDDEAMNTELQSLNKYAAARITYTFGADQVVVDGRLIKDWIVGEGTGRTVDETKVTEYVNSMARQYDTFGKTRTFTTSLGETISVAGGDYGWWMDRATTSKELYQAICDCQQTDMTPVYFGTAAAYGEQDYGTSYVEVDLDHQHVYVYENGQLVIDMDCVSGKPTGDRTTPTGTYGITYKERDATLRGQNYESSVKYWMPFYGNVGLHDASWRSQFGSDIYVTNGSHGCVNLPPEAAEVVFDHVQKGEAVIVYGGIQPGEVKHYLENKEKKSETDESNNE